MDRSKLPELLRPFPARVPMEPQLLERMDCGSYVREKINYCTEREGLISAYVCVPKRTLSKLPAMFCHHQHNFRFIMGKSEVVGLVGNPDQPHAAELAERGFITFAPDAIAFEERNCNGEHSKPNTTSWLKDLFVEHRLLNPNRLFSRRLANPNRCPPN